jgi:hypothetical protein
MHILTEVELLSGEQAFETGFTRERLIEARTQDPPVDWQIVVTLQGARCLGRYGWLCRT